MLKKLLHIVFSFYVIMLVSGIGIHKHYCHNHFIKISLFQSPDSCCDDECPECKNETKVFKFQKSFLNSINEIDYCESITSIFSVFNTLQIDQNHKSNPEVSQVVEIPQYFCKQATILAKLQVYRN